MDAEKYTYRIFWSREDREFVGLCAEFPSLSYLSRTQKGALTGIQRLIRNIIQDMTESNEEIPKPFALREFSGKFQARVSPHMHRELSIQAAEAGVSLNHLINEKLAS